MKQPSITSLPPSPDAERRARVLKYSIAMSIRVLCLFLMLFAQGWWLFVFAAGAILLPYVAVVLANVGSPRADTSVLRPDGVVVIPQRPEPTQTHDSEPDQRAS
ncbi:putative tellurium resistance membrane protein TerC [Mycetocola sp. CAN_C7]|uniref:DUF3099 domain-containing protein n=1 Tax=Mycetocola sp. CAN_C7 TaxID=2787724 RepID=UPI0018C94F26